MNILVVDDHPIILALLTELISNHFPEYKIHTERELDRVVNIIHDLNPELAILDVSIGEKDTIECFKEIKSIVPQTRFIIYSMHNIPGYIEFFKKTGAHAYVLKEEAPKRLNEVIRGVLVGKTYFPKNEKRTIAPHEINQLKFSTQEKLFLNGLLETQDNDLLENKLLITIEEIMEMRKKLLLKSGARNTQELIRLTKKHNWATP